MLVPVNVLKTEKNTDRRYHATLRHVLVCRFECPNFRRQQARLCLSFPQHRLRRPSRSARRALAVPRGLSIARRMVGAVPYQHRIQPHPLLRRVEPFVFKLFLADGADVVDPAGRFWDRDVCRPRRSLGLFVRGRLWLRNVVCIDRLARSKPVLNIMLVRHTYITRQRDGSAYLLVNVPTPMRSSLLRLSTTLFHFEMPVHMSTSLLVTFHISLEAPATFSARRSKLVIQCVDDVVGRSAS